METQTTTMAAVLSANSNQDSHVMARLPSSVLLYVAMAGSLELKHVMTDQEPDVLPTV